MNLDELLDRELAAAPDPATVQRAEQTRIRMWSLKEFSELPHGTAKEQHEQDERDRAQARADAERHGDKLQKALRAGPYWRDLTSNPSIQASDYEVPSIKPKAARD